jgi:hypothetical protein
MAQHEKISKKTLLAFVFITQNEVVKVRRNV